MKTCVGIYVIGFGIVLIVAIILFAVSFQTIDINNYGLKKSTINKKVEEGTVYQPGRYFGGISTEFITYKSTWQYIHFSDGGDNPPISGRTIENENLNLEVSLAFLVKKEQLGELVKEYPNQNHKNDMMKTAKQVVLEVVPKYRSEDFYENRHRISHEISYKINELYKQNYFVEMTLFLLREIQLASKFENKITENLIKQQQYFTTEKENELKELEGRLSNIHSDTQTEVKLINDVNQSKANVIKQEYIANGQSAVLLAESEGYSNFKSAGNADSLVDWGAQAIMKFINWQKFVQQENINLLLGIGESTRVEID